MAAIQGVASLLAVLALAVLAAFGARRFWPGARADQDSGALRLRATLALDSRRRLHLVETSHGPALLLTGGGRDQLLALPRDANAP